MDKKIILETLIVGTLMTNCYILGDAITKNGILIDPGAEADKIKNVIRRAGLVIKYIVLTHGHFDHIGALNEFDLPVYIHRDEEKFLTDSRQNLSDNFGEKQVFFPKLKLLEDAGKVSINGLELDIIHTPGHTPGGICLKIDHILFSGDTLFQSGIGRTDLPGGNYRQLKISIEKKLMCLDDATLVFPGHGMKTTIAGEKMNKLFT